MTRVGDELELDGVRCVVTAVGPLLIYERDEKGVERAAESGRFVHVERVDQPRSSAAEKE